MPERIIFAIQKGGVGKTTSTVATAEILAAAGYKVLVVDADSQGNATRMLTGKSIYDNTGHTLMEAIQEGNAEPYILPISSNLDLIPAEDRFSVFSRYIYTTNIKHPYAVLQRLLEPVENRYDFVFVDTGPTLGDALINALVYADRIIAPVDSGDLAMDGVLRFMEFVDATREEGHAHAEMLGILLTMRDGRSKYEKDVAAGLREAFGALVFDTEIHRRVKIKEMSSRTMDLDDEALVSYFELAEEILERIKGGKRDDQ